MIVCPKCGKELVDGAKFCDNCGEKLPEAAAPVAEAAPAVETIFCTNCGQQTSTEFAFCQNCGASLAETPAAAPTAAAPAAKKPLPKKTILIGAIAAVVVVLIIVIALLAGGGKSAKNYALYIKDDQLNFNDFGKDGAREITERLYEDGDITEYMGDTYGALVTVSQDGKTIFYPDRVAYNDEGFSLYARSLTKKDAEPTKIDSDIREYAVSEDDNLITYRKGEDGILYQYNVKEDEKEKLDSDIRDFYVSNDGKRVVYYDVDGDLYTMTVGEDEEKLDSEIMSINAVYNDLNDIYYTKEGNLYVIRDGGDREKIAGEVYNVIWIYDSGEVYYTTSEESEVALINYVDDDMAASDAAFVMPEYPDYPDYPYWFEYDDDAEYEAAMEEYDLAMEEYEVLQDAYYEAQDTYYDIQDRDWLRENLQDYTISLTSYTLHYFDGTDSVSISDGFIDSYDDYYYATHNYAADTPVLAYSAKDAAEPSKVKISEIYSTWEVEEHVYEAQNTDAEMYVAVAGVSGQVDANEPMRPMLSDDGKTLFFIDDYDAEKGYGDLYKASVSGGESVTVESSMYDSEVYTGYLRILDGEKLLYWKDYNGEKGELFLDTVSIDYDVYTGYVSYNSDAETLTYFTDWSYEKSCGTLKVSDLKESVKVEDDVHAYTVMPSGDILYLYDYSTERYHGELYLYDGGDEPTKIDEDVTAIIPYYTSKYKSMYYGW